MGNFCDRRRRRKQGAKIGATVEKAEDKREAPDGFFGNRKPARSDNPEVVGSSPSPATKNLGVPFGAPKFLLWEKLWLSYLRVLDATSYARWAIFATAAGGGNREQKLAQRSKPTATNGSNRRFWAPQEARSDNPEVVGSSPSPARRHKLHIPRRSCSPRLAHSAVPPFPQNASVSGTPMLPRRGV